MKQFNLEQYLQKPEQKVVTRDGRPVRIICTDRKCSLEYHYPIIALIFVEGKEINGMYNECGEVYGDKCNDLFFVDEEENMTEFEKEVDAIMDAEVKRVLGVKYEAKYLLDIARKQLQSEIDEEIEDEKSIESEIVSLQESIDAAIKNTSETLDELSAMIEDLEQCREIIRY